MPTIELIATDAIYRNPNPGYQHVMAAFSHPVQLSSDELICSYNRGQAIYATDLVFHLARSVDKGFTWREHTLIHDPACDAKPYSYHDPFMTKLSDGALVIAAFRVDRSDPELPIFNEVTGGIIDVEPILFRSGDGGRTWSQPEVLVLPVSHPVTPSTGIVELSDGVWFLPCDRWHAYDESKPYQPVTIGFFSSDQGKNWRAPVTFADGKGEGKGYWHGKIVRLEGGRLFTLFWTADMASGQNLSLHRCLGSPDGRDWSTPEPTNVPGQTNHVADLGNGQLVAIYTQREGTRPGFRAVLSQDYGATWDLEHEVTVWDATGRDKLGVDAPLAYPRSHDTIAFGAPTALRLDDGDILFSFWCTEMSITHVRYARVRVT